MTIAGSQGAGLQPVSLGGSDPQGSGSRRKYKCCWWNQVFLKHLPGGALPQGLHFPPWASAVYGHNGHFPPLEIGIKNQRIVENPNSAASSQVIDLLLGIRLYLPVWHSHWTWCHVHCHGVMQWQGWIQGVDWGDRPPSPLKHTKVTLFTTIFYNSENSIRDIRSFCRPLFCHSSVVKYTWSLSQ